HFEKMLYDNAQLVSLYAEAYQFSKNPLYKDVVFETLEWVKREMTSPEGGFYSALDADSEGVEGKFYTYSKEELKHILGDDEELFSIYFNVTDQGNWHEEHTNVFLRKQDDETIAGMLGLSVPKLQEDIRKAKEKVFNHRSTRIRPGLDNKILAAWNGLMLKAYSDAYRVFPEAEFLNTALANARFILDNLMDDSGALIRSFKSSGSIGNTAFLDDYAFVIEAFISLYEVTFDEMWLSEAKKLSGYALENFYDQTSGLYYYTSAKDKQLIARKHEITDNVIPSSNSVMANNLYKLGHFQDDDDDIKRARQMLQNVFPQIKSYGSAYSNWANLLLNEVKGIYEIAITGPEAESKREELEKFYIPNKIILGGVSGTLSLLKDKLGDKTRIFVCQNRTCLLPVTEITEALKQIN
ncbi:MAG TPA: thioredoxin domain-containing protein, partial [Sphingobacteriaceae bacterium]|nr:thioredoxin domain-containing protein [Sphingobacteriaceae bacterium]